MTVAKKPDASFVIFRAFLALVLVTSGVTNLALAQQTAPDAPETPKTGAALKIDWARFDRIVDIARAVAPPAKLTDAVHALRAETPAEAGNLSPLDMRSLGDAWCALSLPIGKGRTIQQDVSAFAGEDLYALSRKGYRLDREQAARIHARLLSLLGVPSEPVSGLSRGRTIERSVWVVSQVGVAWMRSDLSGATPISKTSGEPWRPNAGFYQASAGVESTLAFLKCHLPDGDQTARLQGLSKPFSLPEWESWTQAELRVRTTARASETPLLFASNRALVTPTPLPERRIFYSAPIKPTPQTLTLMQQLRLKPIRPGKGLQIAEYAQRFVGLPYVWGGESPDSGFDCSGLVQYVCREHGIRMPRTAAEQFHVGSPVKFIDLEPGDLVFLANTYKPGVSHVGIYIGGGKWVQAQGSATGVVLNDVPYFEPGLGPGARRLDFFRTYQLANRNRSERQFGRTVAGVHTSSQAAAAPIMLGGIVQVKVCGDSGDLANSGCEGYKTVYVSKAQAHAMHTCRKHRPRSGENG